MADRYEDITEDTPLVLPPAAPSSKPAIDLRSAMEGYQFRSPVHVQARSPTQREMAEIAARDPAREPTMAEAFDAGLRMHNMVTAMVYPELFVEHEADPNYDPFGQDETLDGYDPSHFVHSRSANETAMIKRRIDRERQYRETAGAWGEAFGALSDPLPWLAAAAGGALRLGRIGTAAADMGAVGASEAFLQNEQYTRTWQDTALNVAGAGLFGALFGNVPVSRELQDELTNQAVEAVRADVVELGGNVVRLDDYRQAGASVGAREVLETTLSDEGITSGRFGDLAEKVFGRHGRAFTDRLVSLNAIGPAARVMGSASRKARALVPQIVDTVIAQNKAARGETSGISFEGAMRVWDGHRVSLTRDIMSIFRDYRRAGGTLTETEFRLRAGRAMSNNDLDPDPFIARAAQRGRQATDLTLRKLVDSGALPADVRVRYAASYFPRRALLASGVEEAQYRRTIYEYYRGIGVENAEELADNAVRKALRGETEPSSHFTTAPKAGATQERSLAIPDNVLQESGVMDTDILRVLHRHLREVGLEVESRARFGEKSMDGQIAEVATEYDQLIDDALAKDDKKLANRLAKERKQTISYLRAMQERVLGIHGVPRDPDSAAALAERSLKTLAFTAYLGGTLVSQIPDFARVIARHGFKGFAKGIFGMLDTATRRMSKEELGKAGTAAELILNNHYARIADMENVGGVFQKMSEAMAKWTGMAGITSFQQQLAGMVGGDAILEAAEAWTKGTINKKQMRDLATRGIDEPMARRITEKMSQYGETRGGLRIPHTDDWTELRGDGVIVDEDVVEAYRAAVATETRVMVTEPGAGDVPVMLTSTELGRLLGQFQGFLISMHNRNVAAGLQQFDASWVTGSLALVTMGALVAAGKDAIRGRDFRDRDNDELLYDAIDRSGLIGVWSYPMNIARSLSGDTPSKWLAHSGATRAMGPGAGYFTEAFEFGVDAARGEPDFRKGARLLPFNDLLHWRTALERGAPELFDYVPYYEVPNQ